MSSYRRPPIEEPVFRDVEGRVIDYGRRWQDRPPQASYSVTTHLERYAPLHTVADALIRHLRDNYQVQCLDGVELAADAMRPVVGVTRAVRIEPNDQACAALTFIFTDFPGVVVHAGLLHDFYYPICGCDACDSTWDVEADLLEQMVHTVVAGSYRESIGRGFRPWVEHVLLGPDGMWSSGRSRGRDLPRARVKAARPILRARADGWAAWPQNA